MIRRQLPLDTYNRAITFLYGTHAELNKVIAKELGAEWMLHPSARGKWICFEATNGHDADYIALVNTGSRNGRIVNLSHECLHCTFHTMHRVGVKWTDESEEAFTYYHQWLFVQCLLLMQGRIE